MGSTYNQDAEHLRLLSIFHYIEAGLAAMVACIPIIHLVIGIVLLTHPEVFSSKGEAPPAILGSIFVLIGGVFVLTGFALATAIFFAGRALAQRRHYWFCFVIAAVNCMFPPVGTALGVFTIIVLMRPSVKAVFGIEPAPAGP
ncbi:MAG: hypothetical protein ABSD56_08070 [Bryobacteraceae bacterium]